MPMYDDANFFFRTSDLALATALCVLGMAIEAMQQSDGQRMFFIFNKSDKLTDLVNRFWRNELLVDPLAYFNQLKVLKTRIYRH
jgi:hypothetical protein